MLRSQKPYFFGRKSKEHIIKSLIPIDAKVPCHFQYTGNTTCIIISPIMNILALRLPGGFPSPAQMVMMGAKDDCVRCIIINDSTCIDPFRLALKKFNSKIYPGLIAFKQLGIFKVFQKNNRDFV